jgi:hypothetical protein
VLLSGCGCGDRIATRRIEIVELGRGVTYPIEVDASRISQDSNVERSEKTDDCGSPSSVLRIYPKQPIRIILVPSTQP